MDKEEKKYDEDAVGTHYCESIGERIGAIAKRNNISLRQLAIKADVPYTTLYAIVTRKSNRVKRETLEKIAIALDIPLQDLFNKIASYDEGYADGLLAARDMDESDRIYLAAISRWGKLLQSVVAMEEMAELTKEISKVIRGSGDIANLTEEMADVYIMLRQLEIMHDISDGVQVAIMEKTARLKARLEGGADEDR